MERDELAQLFRDSAIFSDWHWFRYHFSHELYGYGHPLAAGIISCALECESRMAGYAEALVERIASISGREMHLPDWEQLLAVLAELHVVAQIARWSWPEDALFVQEPTAPGSDKNPELAVTTGGKTYGYEVKAPSLFAHAEARRTNDNQVASRFADRATLAKLSGDNQVGTWPRDNPVKDFLISSEEKFQPFQNSYENFTGILIICWDDFIYEPISALTHPTSGLLTSNSFYRDNNNEAVRFPSVDGVVVLRHLHQLGRACQDKPPGDGLFGPFDYGPAGAFPWKSLHQNPAGTDVPPEAVECLHAVPPSGEMGTEYFPKEYIMWLNPVATKS